MASGHKRKLTVEAVVLDRAGRVLLVRPGYDGRQWELPGGKVKKREFLNDGIVRETFEETGIAVTPLGVVGIYFIGKEGDHDFVFHCEPAPGEPRPNPPEIIDCRYFPTDDLPRKIDPFTLDRIADVLHRPPAVLPVSLPSDRWLRR